MISFPFIFVIWTLSSLTTFLLIFLGLLSKLYNSSNTLSELLTPEIYIIKNDDYMAKKANASKFLSEHAKEGVMVEDSINNPLLASYKGSDKESRIVDEVTYLQI